MLIYFHFVIVDIHVFWVYKPLKMNIRVVYSRVVAEDRIFLVEIVQINELLRVVRMRSRDERRYFSLCAHICVLKALRRQRKLRIEQRVFVFLMHHTTQRVHPATVGFILDDRRQFLPFVRRHPFSFQRSVKQRPSGTKCAIRHIVAILAPCRVIIRIAAHGYVFVNITFNRERVQITV